MVKRRYNKFQLSPWYEYEGVNNTPYPVWRVAPLISAKEETTFSKWEICYGLYRGLPIIPNRSCPDYDKRRICHGQEK